MKPHLHYFSLILQKARSDLISEARRGYMGMLWWVLEPLLYLGAFYVLSTIVLHRGGEGAVSFLLVGLVVWK
ncbi:ABC transporter permease, partial [Candidatus Parcubacteria bacterium]